MLGAIRGSAILAAALAASLAASGALKLATGYSERIYLPRALYYMSAIVEITMAVMMLTRWRAAAGMASVVFFVGGIIMGYWSGDVPCGCLGRYVVLAKREQIMLASTLGFLSSVMLCIIKIEARERIERR